MLDPLSVLANHAHQGPCAQQPSPQPPIDPGWDKKSYAQAPIDETGESDQADPLKMQSNASIVCSSPTFLSHDYLNRKDRLR